MDFRSTWNSVANTFYPIFFAFLLSALLLWDEGVFSWIENWENKWPLIIYSSISILLLFGYIVIDWFDANLVAGFDKEVTRKDIVSWMFSIFVYCTVIVLILKIEVLNVLFFASSLYLFAILLSKIFRDKYADSLKQNMDWQKGEKTEYDRTAGIFRHLKIMTYFDVFLLLALLTIWCFIPSHSGQEQEFNIIVDFLSNWAFHIPFWVLILSIIPNLRLKYRRHKYIFEPLSEQKKQRMT